MSEESYQIWKIYSPSETLWKIKEEKNCSYPHGISHIKKKKKGEEKQAQDGDYFMLASGITAKHDCLFFKKFCETGIYGVVEKRVD